jgi:hypothetical protein
MSALAISVRFVLPETILLFSLRRALFGPRRESAAVSTSSDDLPGLSRRSRRRVSASPPSAYGARRGRGGATLELSTGWLSLGFARLHRVGAVRGFRTDVEVVSTWIQQAVAVVGFGTEANSRPGRLTAVKAPWQCDKNRTIGESPASCPQQPPHKKIVESP